MATFLLSVVSLLASAMRVGTVRYGDYALHMPQYGEERAESDSAASAGDYGDRSPDAAAHLDYKYEEQLHGKPDDLIVRDLNDANVWDAPSKKRRRPPILQDANVNVDLDETEHERKSNRRLVKHRTSLRNTNSARQGLPQKRLKHKLINRSDNIDDFEIKNDYVHVEEAERVDNVDMEENNNFSHKPSTYKKPRRKPRGRSLQNPEWRERDKDAKLEEGLNVRLDKENFENRSVRRLGEMIDREGASKKHKNNYDYEEYYDMKRVQNIKSRLPLLFRQTTVRTLEAETASYSKHGLHRRSNSPTLPSASSSSPTVSIKPIKNKKSASETASSRTTTTETTTKMYSPIGNSSDLSLAERSRLSILKKAQRKESARNVSSTKPPVLLQVTSKMQTVVMVEPRSPETAVRARDGLGDSPEVRRRARRLMRRKLVAGARSIHDLTDNWDEMVCDYIDLSLLEADSAFRIRAYKYAILLILLLFLNLK